MTSIKSYVTARKELCANEDTTFFVQYFCTQNEKQLSRKYEEGSIVAAIAIFSCFFVIIMNFYLRKTTQIK